MGCGHMKAILVHATHVLLDNGFQLTLHLQLFGPLIEDVVLKQAVCKFVEGGGASGHRVELEQEVVLYILIDTIIIIDRPRTVRWRVEEVTAESHKGLVVAQQTKHTGHDICLLGNALTMSGLQKFTTGVIEENGRAKATNICLIEGVIREIRMV